MTENRRYRPRVRRQACRSPVSNSPSRQLLAVTFLIACGCAWPATATFVSVAQATRGPVLDVRGPQRGCAPRCRLRHGASYNGGNGLVEIAVGIGPKGVMQFSMGGTVPCSDGASVTGTFAYRTPGRWGGHSFDGSWVVGPDQVSISGTIGPGFEKITGSFEVARVIDTPFSQVTCGTSGTFTGTCDKTLSGLCSGPTHPHSGTHQNPPPRQRAIRTRRTRV